MTNRAMTVLCVAAVAGLAWAQVPSAGRTASEAYVGVVIGTDVHVRSGPDQSAPACTMLSKPERVTVVGEKRSWLKIEAPTDCYSVVEKDYVKAHLTGQKGTVTGSTVFARPAGPLLQSGFALIQRRLRAGETVDIIGATGKYYKITSPPGAYFWIANRFVVPQAQYRAMEKVRKAPLVPVGRKPESDTTIKVSPPETDTAKAKAPSGWPLPRSTWPPVKPPVRAKAPAKAPAPPAAPSAREAFQAAEDAFKAECQKPAATRDYPTILAKYKAIEVGSDKFLAPYIAERVNFLQQTLDDAEALAEAEKLLRDTAAKQREYDLKLSEAEVVIPQVQAPSEYGAKGVVMASRLFPGGAAAPKRYILRDAKTSRIRAYLQSTGKEVDLASYEGKHVGIVGKSKYDTALMGNVIDVQLVVMLDEEVEIPAPPKPIVSPVAPGPKVAPVPTPERPRKGPLAPLPLPTKRPAPVAPGPERSVAPTVPKKELPTTPPPLPTKRPIRRAVPPLEPTVKPESPAGPVAPEPPKKRPVTPPAPLPKVRKEPVRPIMLPGPVPLPKPTTRPAPKPKKATTLVPPPPLDMPLEPGPKKAPAGAKPTTRPVAPKLPKAGPSQGLPVVDPTGKPKKPPVDAKEFQ